jgi:hypothetical protein
VPYGVSDALWRMLPADDQAAVKAGYVASQASQVAPSGPTQAEIDAANQAATAAAAAANALLAGQGAAGIAAAAAAAGATPDVVQALANSGIPDLTNVTVTSTTPSGGGGGSGGGGSSGGGGGSGSTDFGTVDEDEVVRELYAAGVIDRNDPGGAATRLPSTAWGDFRDYFAKDQPFLGTHIRNQGHQLRSVVASDLWSPST